MKRQIPAWTLRKYLRYYFVSSEDLPAQPNQVEAFGVLADGVKLLAEMDGQLEDVRLGLEYVLANPQLSPQNLAGSGFPYTDGEIFGLLEFLYGRLWPDHPRVVPGQETVAVVVGDPSTAHSGADFEVNP